MKIHEYQAKELLAAAGAAIPRGIVASIAGRGRRRRSTSWAAAGRAQGADPRRRPRQGTLQGQRQGLRRRQVHQDARRRRHGRRGDVQVSAGHQADRRGGPEGLARCWCRRPADIAREIYLGMVLDRAIGLPVLMACAEGGVEIEEVAARSPGEDPQDARRSRRRPAAVPGPRGWPSSWASPASRCRRPRRS